MQFFHEAVELQADRARRQVKLLRRVRHAARLHDREKQFQLVNVHVSFALNVPKSLLEYFCY